MPETTNPDTERVRQIADLVAARRLSKETYGPVHDEINRAIARIAQSICNSTTVGCNVEVPT